jgi:hypothetical protein
LVKIMCSGESSLGIGNQGLVVGLQGVSRSLQDILGKVGGKGTQLMYREY